MQRARDHASDVLRDFSNDDFPLAMHAVRIGDLDAAFEYLQRMLDAHDPVLVHLAVAPQWDSLRADPRFNECLARMKLRPVL
jgi:hypothetical protein